MKGILRKIGEFKRQETAIRKADISLDFLKNRENYHRQCLSLSANFAAQSGPGIIAEFKRRSPSKGIIRENADPVNITKSYKEAGAYAISVLTDSNFFGAQENDFSIVRANIDLPLLRKDFILEEYQVHETKAMGADIMLLIAAMLSPQEVSDLSSLARELGMDVLLELHSENELGHFCATTNLIGVNNRNLDTFEVDIENSKRLAHQLPSKLPKIAESGLSGSTEITDLYNSGFRGFLIGETFMKADDPGIECKNLIDSITRPASFYPPWSGGKQGGAQYETHHAIKVCGMKDPENIRNLADLKPDYLGLIFYPQSPRFVEDPDSLVPVLAERDFNLVGVFVNETISRILELNDLLNFDFVQLHGNETPELCQEIRNYGIKVIKAFGFSETLDISKTNDYADVADMFLFDTKTKNHGGSGRKFNWEILEHYKGNTPFLLSGGIGPEDDLEIKYPAFAGIDLNSRFELSPGYKDISLLENYFKRFRNDK